MYRHDILAINAPVYSTYFLPTSSCDTQLQVVKIHMVIMYNLKQSIRRSKIFNV